MGSLKRSAEGERNGGNTVRKGEVAFNSIFRNTGVFRKRGAFIGVASQFIKNGNYRRNTIMAFSLYSHTLSGIATAFVLSFQKL